MPPPCHHSDAPDGAADVRPLSPTPCVMRSPASTSHAGRCGASAAPPAAPKCPSRCAQLPGGSGRATSHPSTAPCSACDPAHPAPTASALPLGPWGCAAPQGLRRSAPAARCPGTPALTRLPAARPRAPAVSAGHAPGCAAPRAQRAAAGSWANTAAAPAGTPRNPS